MMSSIFKYAYPNAKVRALKGQLLSGDTFRALLNCESFEEVLNVLRSTHYSEDLAELPSPDVSGPQLNSILYRSLFQGYEKTIRSLDRRLQPFFILLYQRYELTNLKTILRGIFSQATTEDVQILLLPTERHTLFSKDALLVLRNVQDVIAHLQGSFFQYPLNRALRRFEEEQEIFPLEMALDLHYYQTLWEAMTKLPADEENIIRKLLGIRLDIMNLTWILRFKEEYHFSPEEILNYTIHHGANFRLKDRRQLSEAKNAGAIFDLLRQSVYRKALPEQQPDLSTLHIALSRYLIAQIRSYFSGNPFQIGVILGYLWVKEFEIQDIISIAEAKRYGLSLEESRHYVIHGEEREK
jgi:V/A-type H+-transporting ATPase subunit C